MKTLNNKLQLNKETIASLSKTEQSSILGGEDYTTTGTFACNSNFWTECCKSNECPQPDPFPCHNECAKGLRCPYNRVCG